MATTPTQLDRQRIKELTEREETRSTSARRARSEIYDARPARSLVGGVASSYQLRDPWPIYLSHGEGPAGLGRRRQRDASTSTTASARWCRATRTRRSRRRSASGYGLGTHFAAPTEDAIVVGEELARRWGCRSGAT